LQVRAWCRGFLYVLLSPARASCERIETPCSPPLHTLSPHTQPTPAHQACLRW
jgi:hypothetical protein